MKDIDIPYASIVTGILFILSEILPFIPKTGNGIMHSIIEFIATKSTKNEGDVKDDSEIEELECINTSERIIELKKKLDEINNEINDEMKKELSGNLTDETDDLTDDLSDCEKSETKLSDNLV